MNYDDLLDWRAAPLRARHVQAVVAACRKDSRMGNVGVRAGVIVGGSRLDAEAAVGVVLDMLRFPKMVPVLHDTAFRHAVARAMPGRYIGIGLSVSERVHRLGGLAGRKSGVETVRTALSDAVRDIAEVRPGSKEGLPWAHRIGTPLSEAFPRRNVEFSWVSWRGNLRSEVRKHAIFYPEPGLPLPHWLAGDPHPLPLPEGHPLLLFYAEVEDRLLAKQERL